MFHCKRLVTSLTVSSVQTNHKTPRLLYFHGKSSSNRSTHKTNKDDNLLTLWYLVSGMNITQCYAQNTKWQVLPMAYYSLCYAAIFSFRSAALHEEFNSSTKELSIMWTGLLYTCIYGKVETWVISTRHSILCIIFLPPSYHFPHFWIHMLNATVLPAKLS
jgi:hypothetical protein